MASPPQTIVNGSTITASGNSNPLPVPIDPGSALSVLITTASIGGTTPNYTFEVQWSNDNATFASAETPDTFTAITANGSVVKRFTTKGAFWRLKYTVTGTNPTAVVTASAVTTD